MGFSFDHLRGEVVRGPAVGIPHIDVEVRPTKICEFDSIVEEKKVLWF